MRIVKILTSVVMLLFLALSPGWLLENLGADPWMAFWTKPAPAWQGRIELWHVAEFRTWQGSVTDFLQQRADAYWKKQNRGVHIDVVGLTPEKYADRIARGLTPDAYSFPAGLVYAEQLQPMDAALPALTPGLTPGLVDGALFAAPLLYSGYYLAANGSLGASAGLALPQPGEGADKALLQQALELPGKASGLYMPPVLAARAELLGTLAAREQFMGGETALGVLDARTLGDIFRGTAGNLSVAAVPYPGYTEQTLYLGVGKNADPGQAAAFSDFVEYLLTQQEQQRLAVLGAMPAARLDLPPAYGERVLTQTYECREKLVVPEPFAYQRHRAALTEEALLALTGDGAAKEAFFRRMAVVETGGVW